MTIQIISVSESQAKNILFLVGFLDVLFSLIIFIPNRFNKLAFWGFVTALARIVAGFNSDSALHSIHSLSFLTIYSLPHGHVPFAVLIIETKLKNIFSLNNF